MKVKFEEVEVYPVWQIPDEILLDGVYDDYKELELTKSEVKKIEKADKEFYACQQLIIAKMKEQGIESQ